MNNLKKAIKCDYKINKLEAYIEYYKRCIKSCRFVVKSYNKELKQNYESLDEVDRIKFGTVTGYIEKQ